jgi:acetone carboxylase gamma subunit
MGRGLKAYKLTVGPHAKTVDLVEIFADWLDVIPASVPAQEQFYRDWLASPRS